MNTAASPDATKCCPYCGETVLAIAQKCKHCGEYLDESLRQSRMPAPPKQWNPGIAAVLSLVIPGVGQMYKGQVANGIAWLIFVVGGYLLFVIPGVILHLLCILGAASGNPTAVKKGWIESFKEGLHGKK
jgi:TM2 domain-containing membrane protein YozV